MKIPDLTKGLVVATLFATSVSVSAVAIIQGQSTAPSGSPPPAWSTQLGAPIMTDLLDYTGFTWKASVESKVYSSYEGNPYGGYTFEYKIANTDLAKPGALGGFFIGFEPMSELDVSYLTGTGSSPSGVFMDGGGQLLGWLYAFGSDPGLTPGETSTLVVHSPYKAFTTATVAILGGGSGQIYNAYVPAVPEPSTYAALFAMGLAGFAAFRRFQA